VASGELDTERDCKADPKDDAWVALCDRNEVADNQVSTGSVMPTINNPIISPILPAPMNTPYPERTISTLRQSKPPLKR
jgi:hypothetical protein